VGSSDLPAKDRFSKETPRKSDVEFCSLLIERGKWIPEEDPQLLEHDIKLTAGWIRQIMKGALDE